MSRLKISLILLLVVGCNLKENFKKESVVLKKSKLDNLKYISGFLKEDIPGYSFMIYEDGFSIEKGTIIGANIYDLITGESSSEIENNHIYHISPIRYEYSYSYIIVVVDDRIFNFKFINCENKGDNIDEAVKFIKEKLPISNDKHEVINRVRNYRNFGVFMKTDSMSFIRCFEIKE